MTTTSSLSLSAAQAQALLDGLTVLTQRLDELSTSQAFTTEMVGLSQPMATMQQIGQVLADGLSQPVGDLVVSSAKTVAEIKTLIQTAVAAVGDINLSAITESIETLADREILWFDLALNASTTLADYSLSLGQSPSSDAGAPSLLDQGLKTGDIAIDVKAKLDGNIRIGIDLRPGLAADQAIVFQVDNLEACASANGLVQDVSVSYGILDLGELDARVNLEACVLIDLVEGALGHLSLGDLNVGSADSLFNLSWPGASDSTADLSVDFDFDLDVAGFTQSGRTLTLGIEALNGFDLGTLELVLPEIQIDGASVDFDFTQFAQISLDDLGNYLTGLQHWLPQWGNGFELPLLGGDLGDFFDLGQGLSGLIDGLKDDDGNWSFDGIHSMLAHLATGLGIPEAEIAATFQLNWDDTADALEWTLPWSHAYSASVEFDAQEIVPADSLLAIQASGSASVTANLDFSITGGIALTSSAGMVTLSNSSLLSSLNSGVGLRSNGLISGDDLHFTLADGSTLGRDLNITGLGTDGSAGTATLGDLLAVLNVAGRLEAKLEDNHLVLKDLTSGSGTFSVTAPSVTVTIGTGGSAVSTTSTSVAPLMLGLWGASAELVGGAQVITGASLESISPQDRIYIKEQAAGDPLISGTVTVEGTIDGGAALGPLSLQVVDGQVHGSTQWDLLLIDPAIGADDGRIYLSELIEADLSAVLDHQLTTPSLQGIFQLAVTPDALNTALNIDPAHYSTDPLDRSTTDPSIKPDTNLVPYLELNLAAGSTWDFSITPSEKLKSLFSNGFSDFSWDDLPDLIDTLILSLEDTALWQLPIPMTDLTLGDLFEFGQMLVDFSLPDLNTLLGDISGTLAGSAGIGDWKLDFDADFDLALGELQSLDLAVPDIDLSVRFEQLQVDFSNLLLAWEGRDAGNVDFEADFLIRLGAWKGNLSITLDDLNAAIALAFPSSGSIPGDLSGFKLTIEGLLDFIDTIPFGLDGFATVLEGLFMDGSNPRIPGLTLDVSMPTIALSGSDKKVLFDLNFDLDASQFSYDLDLNSLDLGTAALTIDGAGKIAATLDGSLHTQIGFDLGTLEPIFDLSQTSATLTLGVTSDPGTTLSANLGGLATVAIGSTTPADPIVVSLTATASSSAPAIISYASGALSGSAHFQAALPLYVDLLSTGMTDVGTVTVTADANYSAGTPSFAANASFDGNLSSIFAQGEMGLSGWINGAILFIDALTTLLESDLVNGLPFVEDIDLSSDGFLADLRGVLVTLQGAVTTTLADVQAQLNDALDDGSKSLDGSVSFYINGAAATADQLASTMDELFGVNFDANPSNDISNFVVDLGLTGLIQKTIDFGDLDLGLGALDISGTGGLDMAASFGLNLGLGYSPTQGFYVQGTSNPAAAGKELTVDLGLGLSNPSAVQIELGPMRFGIADGTPGDIATKSSRELSATLDLDLGSGTLTGAGADLLDNLTVTGQVMGKLDIDLNSNVGLGMGLTTGFYEADGSAIDLSWTPADGLEWNGGDALADYLHFDLSGVYIDFDQLFGDAISEMASRLAQAFEPMAPVLDMLTDEVPLISDLSKKLGQGSVTYLDAIGWFGEGLDSATEFIATLNTLVDMNSELARTGRFYLGSLGLGSSESTVSAMSASSAASGEVSSSSLSYTEDAGGQSDAVSSTDRSSLFDNKWGLDFPILEQPSTELFELLFGGEADLITWNIPDLNAGFELRKSFPIFPPLFVELFGGVNFQTNFDLGYDTRGIRLAMDSGDATQLIKGVYLHDDHTGVTGASNDPELSLSATIGAGAKLDVVVAQAGVEGGLKGTLAADLADPDNNGKVYVDELADQLSDGIECVFDLSGSLEVFLSAYIKVGIDTPFGFVTLYKDRFKLAEATILDWSAHLCEPTIPVLAEPSGSTLTLNMGSRAGLVIPGETEDGNEVFLVEFSGGKTLVTAYGYTEEFTGINKIVFDAGIGNDTVLIAPSVTAAVEGRGGDGNDNLQGGSGPNKLWGDAGSDVLSGRAAADSLLGGDDDDFLYGYGGADTLDGGDGDDEIYGEDDIGDMIEFEAKNADFKAGTAGADQITGGAGDDLIVAGDGNDTVLGGLDDDAIDAGAGDDSVEAGDGNDQVLGGAGDDKLYGDNKDNSTVLGTSHDDKIEGGEGYNQIWGGAGNDLLYAADEDQLASASGSTVGSYSSRIEGGDGADMIYGTKGKDFLSGGFESDYIDSGDGHDFLLGGPGGDALLSTGGNSTLLGGHGNDVIDGGNGANWIEGGPGDDQIYARIGADTVYGGTTNEATKGGYAYLMQDMAGSRAVDEAEHGGFRATPAADSCGPEIYFYPEVYAPTGPLTVNIFSDTDRDSVRDTGESLVATSSKWQVSLIQAPDGPVVWQGEVTGGQLVREVPDGTYEVRVASGTDNTLWPSSAASLSTFVQMTGGVASLTAQMGWYSPSAADSSDIVGRVTSYNSSDKSTAAVAGAVVFLDADSDGSWDSTETYTTTAADGSYALRNLGAGTYAVAVTDDGICALPAPRSASVKVDGVSDTKQDFSLVLNTAPVVSQVQLFGGPTGTMQWIDVPDGNEQTQAINPNGAVSKIAIDLCSVVGVNDSEVSAQLINLSGGNPQALKVVGSSLNRVEFGLANDGMLQFGSYQLVVDAKTLTDLTKVALDGEWKFPQGYDSGDGTALGNFVFDFVVGTSTTSTLSMSAASPVSPSLSASATTAPPTSGLPQGTVSVGGGTGTLQGMVWAHDGRGASLARDAQEVGLAGQIIEVRSGTGALVATVLTGLDVNANGQISSDEAGVFKITNLPAGNYTVTQLPTDSWVQGYSSGYTGDKMLTVAAGTSGDSTLALVEGTGGSAKVISSWAMMGFRARDVAFKSADAAYAIGTTADGKPKLIEIGITATSLVTKDLAEPPVGFKSSMVGLDLVGDQYLLVTAADGNLLRYNLAGRNWMQLGKLTDGGLVPVYPVGDVAVASTEKAYAVVSTSAPTNDLQPRPDSKQYLLEFDPRTLTTVSMKELTTQSPLVGLDLASSGRLAGLDTLGQLYDINPSSGAAGTALKITGQLAATIGGLSLLPGGTSGRANAGPVTTSTQDGKTTDIGFGNVPAPTVLPDGDDTIDGGCGPEGDLLNGDDGSLPSEVISVGGNDSIRGRDGNDTLIGGLQGDTLLGEAGNDSLVGGSSENNRMDGGAGKDTLTGGSAADFMAGGDDADSLSGGAGNDWLHGQGGDDSLQGQDGHDLLVGGAGNDSVAGGNGDDTLVVVNKALSGADYAATPEAAGGGSYSGDGGNDKLVAVMEGFAGTASMALSNAQLRILSLAPEAINSIESALLVGSDSADTLDAATFTGNSALYGKGGNDSLSSGGNSDVLAGGAGQNSLSGAAGNDLYIVDSKSTGDRINEGSGGGNDTVDASAVTSTITANVSSTGTTAGSGSGGPAFEFSSNIERLLLGSGSDTVNLAAGLASTMTVVGGAGSDTLNYSSWPATSPVSVNLATGVVTGLGAALEFDNAVGGKGNDTLVGTAESNTLDGGEGNDSLSGGAGADSLLGQAGNDSLFGELGQDTLNGGAGSNRLEGGAGDDVYQFLKNLLNEIANESASSGSDTLNFSGIVGTEISYTLNTTDTLAVTIGSSGSTVQAQSKAALETVIGGAAQDRFVFSKAGGTAAVLDGGGSSGLPSEGNTLDYSAYVTAVTVQLPSKPGLAGTATATGGIKNISRVIGGSDADTLTAGADAAYLEGGLGADLLTGGEGNDSLVGGMGGDILVGGGGLDTAYYSGARSSYSVSWDASTKQYTVSSATEGSDTVSQVETFVFNGVSYSAISLIPGLGGKVSVTASTWNGRSMKAVSLASGAETDSSGSAFFDKPSAPLSLSPKCSVDDTARSEIDLNDAIQILKSIVGLTTFNPYQTIAADLNNNSAVDLNDAISVLKQIVGLPAPEPAWVFVDKKSTLPRIDEALSLGDADVELVGILKGDVDGSWGA